MKIVSIDVGTSYIKGAVVKLNESTRSMEILDTASARHVVNYDGIVYEHSPKHVLTETLKMIRRFARQAEKVDALVFSTYLFSTVLMSKNEEYLTNVITWLDRRSEQALDEVYKHAGELYSRTGCPPLYIYTLPKLMFLRRADPAIIRNSYVLDAKAMVFHYFTGELVTDLSTASGTHQMLNIWDLKWDDTALSLAGLDESQLPRLEESDYVARIKPSIARETGLPEDTPVVLGLYDGGSTIFGLSGCSREVGVINMGTSSMLRVTSPTPVIDSSGDMGIQSYYLYRRTWIPGLGLNNCGIVLEYVSKVLGISLEEFVKAINTVDPEVFARSNTPVVVPLLYPERHPKISKDTGVWLVGVREGVSLPLIACSVLEGLVLLIRFVSDVLASSGATYSYVVAGGKVSSIPIVAHLLASALGKPVRISQVPDAIHAGNVAMTAIALGCMRKEDVPEFALGFAKDSVYPQPQLGSKIERDYDIFKRVVAFATSL